MNVNDLAAALRACAAGLCPVEAGVALLISNGTFLHRDDFTSRLISHGTSGTTPMAPSTGPRRPPPCKPANCPAPAENAAFSSSQPASPQASPPTYATR